MSSSTAQSWPAPPTSAAAAGANAAAAAAGFAANLTARGRSSSITRTPRTPQGSGSCQFLNCCDFDKF